MRLHALYDRRRAGAPKKVDTALSKFNQNCADVPSAADSSSAVSGVIARLAKMISFTTLGSRPRISANWVPFHPRASSSSRKNSPGGNTTAGTLSFVTARPSMVLVIVLNSDDPHCLFWRLSRDLKN